MLLLRKNILAKASCKSAGRQEPFYFRIKVITRPMYWYIKWSHPWEDIIKKCISLKLYISIHKERRTKEGYYVQYLPFERGNLFNVSGIFQQTSIITYFLSIHKFQIFHIYIHTRYSVISKETWCIVLCHLLIFCHNVISTKFQDKFHWQCNIQEDIDP